MKRFICCNIFFWLIIVSVLSQEIKADSVEVPQITDSDKNKDKRNKGNLLMGFTGRPKIGANFECYKSKGKNFLRISIDGERELKYFFSREGDKAFLKFTDSTRCELTCFEASRGYVVSIFIPPYGSAPVGYFEQVFALSDSIVHMLQDKEVFKITVIAQRTTTPLQLDFETLPKRREKFRQLAKKIY